jgi:hypothetical protein
MKCKELLQTVPALALAGCAGGLGATSTGLANQRLWTPNDKWNLGPGPTQWTMSNYLISFQAAEPKNGTPPQLFIYDTTESNAWVGEMYPTDTDTVAFWFQDPNVYGGKRVGSSFQYHPKPASEEATNRALGRLLLDDNARNARGTRPRRHTLPRQQQSALQLQSKWTAACRDAVQSG